VMSGLVLTANGWGMLVGALTGGFLSDIYGRRTNFTWALAVFAVFTFIAGFAQNPWQMIAARAIGGWGMGAETDSCTTYIQELYPSRMRGRVTSVAFGFGISLANLGCMAIWILLGIPYGWQWVFWWGGSFAVIVYIIRLLWLPESPRWLQAQGRWEEAEHVMAKLEKDIPVESKSKYLEDVKTLASKALAAPVEKEHFKVGDLLSPDYRKRTAVCWSMTFLAYMGDRGYYAWITPLLILAFGSTVGALAAGIPLSLGMFFGAVVISGLVTDRIGRKTSMIISSVMMTVFALVLGQIFGVAEYFWWVIVFAILIRVAAGVFYPNQYTYVTEQYPTRFRALSFATSTTWSRLTDSTAAVIFGYIISTLGARWIFNISAVFLICPAIILALWGISTKGKTLEELSK